VIAFVALGGLPPHLGDALLQARRSNPAARVVLLHEGAGRAWRRLAAARAIELHDVGGLRGDPRLRAFYARRDPRAAFRNGFWQHTSGRFFALRAFMEREGVERLTHLENDVLLYATLDALDRWAPFAGPALATVFESPRRAIPALVHVGARRCLDAFTDFVLEADEPDPSNDMVRFAAFRRARPGLVADLPTLPPRPDRPAGETTSLFDPESAPIRLPEGGWLFDGARFGQYLGGIDPRNSGRVFQRWLRWQPGGLAAPNGFVNEDCADDPSRYAYAVVRSGPLAVPGVRCGARTFPLATLHVHSKKLRRFVSDALERAEGDA
jgi:hypothetical protein